MNDNEMNEYLDDSLNLSDDEKLLSECSNDDDMLILNESQGQDNE